MGQTVDISTIEAIVRRASRRLRGQRALDGATTAVIVAAVASLLIVFFVRTGRIDQDLGWWALLIAPWVMVLAGAAIASRRRDSAESVARHVDRASGLSDRLSTAIAFDRMLARDEVPESGNEDREVTRELMRAAIRDGVAVVASARVEAATPYRWPRDLRAALGFAVVCALAAGVALPPTGTQPRLYAAVPDYGAPGTVVQLQGSDLLSGAVLATSATARSSPSNASVFLGEATMARPVSIRQWTSSGISVVVPADAPLGETRLTAYLGKTVIGPVRFVVVDAKDKRFHKEDAVAIEEDELEYIRTVLSDIRMTARQDDAKELDDYIAKVEKLLEQAERGELNKEQLLREMEKAQAELNDRAEPDQDEVAKQLADTGKELASDPLTQELGKALQNNDLEQAKKELEKLADQLDKNQLSEMDRKKLAKTLEKTGKEFDKRQLKLEDKQKRDLFDLEEQIRRLEKEKLDAKTDLEREDAERRLEKKKEALQKLAKEQKEENLSAQREAVKRLHKDLESAAEQLQKRQDQNPQQDQQASGKLKDAARETGRVEQEQRKQAAQKKVASQMEELKEAMRRAKQKGNKGPQSPFGKDRKQSDFMARARGQQGSRAPWKPGQGKGQGQGQGQGQQGQPPGQGSGGQQPGGNSWGTGHDDNLTGDPTAKGGHTKDEDLQGVQGKSGPSRRETILSAAQKGFATAKYQQVYADYKRVIEEVMRSEKVPSSYKYYVKRYFNQIKPKN
jgi:hypothetical protein